MQQTCHHHQYLEAAGRYGISPAIEGVTVAGLNDGGSEDSHGQVSSLLLDHALGERLREGIRVRVVTQDCRLLFSDGLGPELHNFTDNYVWIVGAIGLVVNFLLYFLIGEDVAVDVGG